MLTTVGCPCDIDYIEGRETIGTPSTKLTTLEQLQMQAVRIKAELEKCVKASDAAIDEEVEKLLNEVFSKEENIT